MDEKDVYEVQSVERRSHEHEVFLAFNSDYMAEAFHEWWEASGRKAFVDYVNEV